MKKALITGGLGMVGSHLVKKLVEVGNWEISIVDSDKTRLWTIEKYREKIKTIYPMDISMVNTPYEDDYDVIFHLACHPRTTSYSEPRRDEEINVGSTVNMLEILRKHGGKIIFAGNSGCYPNRVSTPMPISEWYEDEPTTPYDAAKISAEAYIKAYTNTYEQIKATLFRFATVYGSNQILIDGWHPVISEFVVNCLTEKQSIINGSGQQTRDFIHADDLVEALLIAAEMETPVMPIILSTNTEITINQLYKTIAKLTGCNLSPRYGPAPLSDPQRMRYNNATAKTRLGWDPKISLEDGLRNDVIPYWKGRLGVS